MSSGEVVSVGSRAVDPPGYDLTGLLVGSEGTLGIVTSVTVRLLRRAEAVQTLLAVFETIADASAAVSDVIAEGIVPTAMEMIDGVVMRAVEASIHAGYPGDAGAVLLIEVESLAEADRPDLEQPRDQILGRRHARISSRMARAAAAGSAAPVIGRPTTR